MDYKEIIKNLKNLSDPRAVEGMAKFGISAKSVYGVSIPNLRKLARMIGKDHDLARKLWEEENRETRILASMIEDYKAVKEPQLDRWVKDFDSWEVCDQCCMNLFEKTRFAYQKAFEWSAREEEFVKRAGFVMMARLAVSDKYAPDEKFVQFFSEIKRHKLRLAEVSIRVIYTDYSRSKGQKNRNALDVGVKLLLRLFR